MPDEAQGFWEQAKYTLFSQHLGERLHVATFARPSKYVLHLAMSVQRAGGVLNVLGARDDIKPVPAEFQINDDFRKEINFAFAYGAEDGSRHKELGYRRILFKRLLFLWRLAKTLPPSDVLLYVDGDDVLFQRPLDDVVATWRDMVGAAPRGGEPVIFMGYPHCAGRFDGDHARVRYPLRNSERGLLGAAGCARWRSAQLRGTLPFLDSGGYIGRASMVREVLEEALEFARLGLDYICMSTLTVAGIRLGTKKMFVDTEARLFWAVRPIHKNFSNYTPAVDRPLCTPEYFDLEGSPAAFTPTGHTPSVLHFVGPAKWYWLSGCMDGFRARRRLELERGFSGAAARDVSSACSFLFDEACHGQCAEGIFAGKCACYSCSELYRTYGWYDVDRDNFLTFDLTQFLDLADQGLQFKLTADD